MGILTQVKGLSPLCLITYDFFLPLHSQNQMRGNIATKDFMFLLIWLVFDKEEYLFVVNNVWDCWKLKQTFFFFRLLSQTDRCRVRKAEDKLPSYSVYSMRSWHESLAHQLGSVSWASPDKLHSTCQPSSSRLPPVKAHK